MFQVSFSIIFNPVQSSWSPLVYLYTFEACRIMRSRRLRNSHLYEDTREDTSGQGAYFAKERTKEQQQQQLLAPENNNDSRAVAFAARHALYGCMIAFRFCFTVCSRTYYTSRSCSRLYINIGRSILRSFFFFAVRFEPDRRIKELDVVTRSADLAIEIPGNLSQGGATYRLDYTPRVGYPPPNTTIAASDIGDVIKFRDGLPGTRYEYWLFYTNDTLHDWLTWTASITTPPDPPSNLTVQVKSGKSAVVHWDPPRQGNYSGFRLRVQSFNDAGNPWTSVVPADAAPYTLRDLTPGATYSLQLYTVLDTKESVAYTSRNFTAKPNTPGKFIVWFRNETTLLVLWQPPYPPGIYTYYKVSIDPQDAAESVLYIEKESEPPGPAQAAFKGLIPGRAYNISVQTVSEDETSAPTTAQYRTVPLRPLNATFDNSSVTSTSFKVYWQPPNGTSEFDKYQISLAGNRRFSPVTRNREDECKWEFKDLEPGKTYQVVVKTFSGKVSSWPASKDVTLKPLAVRDLHAEVDEKTGMVEVSWIPDNSSTQDSYKIEYHEIEGTIGGDGNVLITNKTRITLEALLPGRNYSICVQAISNKVESNETILYQVTKPSSPIIEDLKSIEKGLNISWKSDVNSRQEKFEVTHNRNDTGESATTLTTESHIMLEDLHPGAGYEVKVFAISHGLRSEPHSYFQAVLPHPPRNLSIEKVTANTVVVHWSAPTDSIFSEYAIRYRTADDPRWVKLPAVKETEAEVTDMSPGERYTIQVNTVSFGVESLYPLNVSHTIRPNPAVNITPVIDSTNVTLEFIRPEGRIEYYVLKWWPAEIPEGMRTKNVTASSLLGYEDPYLGSSVAPVLNPNIERILVDDLIPGVEYVFTVYAVSYDLVSDTTSVKTRTMPLIQSEVVVVVDRDQPDSLHLRYTPTPRESSHFDLYRFRISDAVNTTQERTINDTAKVSFTGLIPGRLYNVTVWTVSENVESRPLIRSDRLYPEPVTIINATEINDTKISLAWDPPRGEYEAFEVQYTNHENVYVQNITTQNGITIEGLRPYRNYTFTVVVRSGSESNYLRHSNPLSASFTTSESYPGRVDKFHPTNVLPSEISFEWSLPASEQNGIIRKFSITYGLEGSTFTQARDFKPTDYRGTIKNLMPGKTYIFRIQAETRVGYGPEVIWKETMQILAPPKPPPQVVPSEVSKTSTTIQIRFRKNYFADANGPVTSYTIIVAEDDSKNASGYEMARWRDVQKYSVWPPYQGHNSPREFIVTQGPLPSTKDDFWRMVWESNSRAIVMLTRCIEKGREKCDHYWPTDTIPVYYGDISVTVLNETHYQDWSITEFMLRKGGESRVIQHFHFTTWPDFGVPSPPQTLVRFVRAFRERVQPDQRPIVVHCSAGVGRSGTFITLDRILQQILVSDYVDIFGIVWTMRKERVWMVQTEQQYICIHQCLLAVLEGLNGGNGPPREIHDNQGFEEKKSSSIGSANSSRVEGENSNANDNENDDENEIDVDDEEDDDDDDDDDGDDDDVDDEVVVNENDSDDEAESASKNVTENYTLTIENEKEKSHDIISIKDNDSEPDNVSKNGIENENETKNEKENKNEIEKKSAKVIETER
ncbi:unnamed protein product [Trichogramma brassicae]|uniref:Uncharacterized protein n=1 Tax=Trichogramma brassicae TaxID=86971 RepID=A0A6H5ICQ5_9HYME|nr:unnamed protein product [Trichogramma brassicae]